MLFISLFIFYLFSLSFQQQQDFQVLFNENSSNYIVTQDNGYIFLFTKHSLYIKQSGIFDFTLVKNFEVDDSYNLIHAISDTDSKTLKDEAGNSYEVNYYDYSYVIFEKKEGLSSSFIAEIFNIKTYETKRRIQIDALPIFLDKFFMLTEKLELYIIGKADDGNNKYRLYSECSTCSSQNWKDSTVFYDSFVFEEIICTQGSLLDKKGCYYLFKEAENSYQFNYISLNDDFQITEDASKENIKNCTGECHIQLFYYYTNHQNLICISSNTKYDCSYVYRDDFHTFKISDMSIDNMKKLNTISNNFAIFTKLLNIYQNGSSKYLTTIELRNCVYNLKEEIELLTDNNINSFSLLYSATSKYSCMILFSDENNLYYIPYTFQSLIVEETDTIEIRGDNKEFLFFYDIYHTQSVTYPNGTLVFDETKMQFYSFPEGDYSLTSNDIEVNSIEDFYYYHQHDFYFTSLISGNYTFYYTVYFGTYKVFINYTVDYKCSSDCIECENINGKNYCINCQDKTQYIIDGMCSTSSCSQYFFEETINEQTFCFTCPDKNKYYSDGECVSDIPSGYYVNPNDKYGIILQCNQNCATCKDISTKCTSCFQGEFLFNDKKCITECNAYLFEDNKCIDCKGEYGYRENEGCFLCLNIPNNYLLKTNKVNWCLTEIPERYYSDNKNVLHPCKEGCKNCSDENYCEKCLDDYYIYNNECYSSCPLTLIELSDTKECYSCKKDGIFLNYTSRTCIDDFPEGYYLYKDRDDNVLYPCHRDCSVAFPNEDSSFCGDENISHKCSSKIIIDSSLSLHYEPFTIEQTEITNFTKMIKEEQNILIDEVTSSLINNSENVTQIMEDIFILNHYASFTEDEDKKKDIHKNTMNSINSNLNCEQLLSVIEENESMMIYTSSFLIYQTIKTSMNYITEDDIVLLSKIEKCLIEKGIENYNDQNYNWIQKDFFEMTTKSTDNLLFLLESSNNTTENETLLIVSEARKSNKQVIENISKMQSSFKTDSFQKYENFEFITKSFDDIKKEQYNNNNMIITTSPFINSQNQLNELIQYNISTKIYLPYDNIKQLYPQVDTVSIINYKYYPLLNPLSITNISKSFNAILLRDKNNNIVDINNLTEPIRLILKKSNASFNECVFYDEKEESLKNSNCNSTELNEEYIMCSCYHLTDFSLSKYNPVALVKDIVKLFQQARIINSFVQFKYINASNAIVLYVVFSIIVIYSILLVLAIKHDRKEGDSQFVLIIVKGDSCCKKANDDTEDELRELDKKIKEHSNRRGSKSNTLIEMKTITNDSALVNNKLQNEVKKENELNLKEDNKEQELSLIYTYYLLLKEFFTKEYWFCTFINSEDEMSKVNILTIFFIRLVVSLSICSIFTECSSIEDENNELYNNRDLAVSVATILIMELPFTLFEVLLAKTKITWHYALRIKRIARNTKYRHIIVYILFVIMLVFGTVNTLWISLDSYHNDYECNFMTDFFISTIFDCFIFQIITLILKSLIYIVILKGRKNNCLRGCLICVVSSLPWIFNL